MVTELFAVEVESLPTDLPEKIVIDLSNLKHIGDSIYVRDLEIPANVQILQDPDEVVVLVAPGAAEEISETEGGIDMSKEPERIAKVRKEGTEEEK